MMIDTCHRIVVRFRTPVFLSIILIISGCTQDKDLLETIKERQELRIVTRNSPTSYYEGPFGSRGLEYDMVSLFARRLNVKLKLIVEENLSKMFSMIKDGKADIAAAGLTITTERKAYLLFGPSYQKVTQQLIYRTRHDSKRPRKIEDIIGADIDVVAHSSHAETLALLGKIHPDLTWHENDTMDSNELLELVWSQFIDYTIADSTEIKLIQRFMPELAVAFNIRDPESIAWAMQLGHDYSLYNEVVRFFNAIKKDGVLKQLINRYYGHVRKFNYVGTRNYMRDIANKLPQYMDAFKLSAWEYKLDWRLLAAIGYQESLWNPGAISPTGVKGIMMLTNNTARLVGIQDRTDPDQSIQGGAKYFRYMLDKIPAPIAEPDRTWMALAAYNVGYGHLEDARIITQKLGKDPDKWVDVRESLPLLSKKKWYKKTRYGYARGREPVAYVSHIRNYYELLVWQDESGGEAYNESTSLPAIIDSPAL